MTGRTVGSAIILLVIGNLMAILSDTVIKLVSADIAVFQFVAMRLVCTLLLLMPLWPMIDWRGFFRGSRIHLVRAHVGLFGIICMVVALSHLELAVANAIFYGAPVLVMLFGVLIFGERLRAMSLFTVISGLAGVMIILRPSQMSLAGLAALGLALALAVNALLVRKLPYGQPVPHTLLLTALYAMPAAFALALWEGEPVDYSTLGAAFGSAFFIIGYNVTVILAYRHVDANRVTASEYTGLVWAFAIGWWMFGEVPDAWFYIGAAMIVVPLFAQAMLAQPSPDRDNPVPSVSGSRRGTSILPPFLRRR